jgi:hypothetical protein
MQKCPRLFFYPNFVSTKIVIMRYLICIILLGLVVSSSSAQEVYNSSGKPGFHKKTKKSQGYDPSKLVIGGGLNAGYGNGGYGFAGISPIVGYQFANHFTAGIGLGYQYYQAPDDYFAGHYVREHIIYPSMWARYVIWRGLYLTASFEHDFIKLSEPAFDNNNPYAIVTRRLDVNTNCLLAGIGIKQPLGGRVSFFFEAMHEMLNEDYNPYALEPIVIRAGIAAGL